MKYDVIIIGAGVSGAAAARELARFKLTICVLEKEEDVCCGTSKANSAVIHAGYDAASGTLKARLNVAGSRMMEEVARELDVPYRKNGSLVVCMQEEDREGLTELYERGLRNGVTDLRIVEGEELRRLEPNLSENAVAALYAPGAAIIDPFLLNIAMAENAFENGASFFFNEEVTAIERTENGFRVRSNGPEGAMCRECAVVVNAAGVFADRIHRMVSAVPMHITARRGDYYLLDKSAGGHVSHTVFALPRKNGKGVLVAPTIHGNLIVGPDAVDQEDKDEVSTTRESLSDVAAKCQITVKDVPLKQVITSFAGLRAHEDGGDFIIGEVKDAPGFVDCAGIESPGLSSCPAIGVMVADIVAGILHPEKNEELQGTREGILRPGSLSREQQSALIRENPAYGTVICRCETVTEGEIVDAIRRPLGARSLDGVKRRTRAGMGRCQSGFCMPRVMDILARELSCDVSEVTKCGGASRIILGRDKEDLPGVSDPAACPKEQEGGGQHV